MRIPILTFGAIASILTINSVLADTVVTSRNYVDTQDALKQDKITAGTTGSVVTYNGAQNGQTQFSERGIYDGTNDYDETTDANKLITAGAVDGMVGDVYDYVDDEISNIPAPELPTGNWGYAVLYDENGDIGGEMPIDTDGECWYNSDGGPFDCDTEPTLVTIDAIKENIADYREGMSTGGHNKLITQGGVQVALRNYQEKKTCTRWPENAAHTDANCLLWNLP